jgi:hypothetical protein
MPKFTQEKRNRFEHNARQYYLRCAKDALPLASLPEFKFAIDTLEWYDQFPTPAHRKMLMKVYRDLRKGERDARRAYGYTAVGEFYVGLLLVIRRTLFHPNEVRSSFSAYFAEAYYCAAWALGDGHRTVPDVALRSAYARYGKIYNELFPREAKEAA